MDGVEASVRALAAAGARISREPGDVGGGKRSALVRGLDGNVIGPGQDD